MRDIELLIYWARLDRQITLNYISYIEIKKVKYKRRQMLSRVISMRFQDNQVERLGRLARRLGRTPSEASVLLVEEALREEEFGYIDFRNSPGGRQAYVKGTTLAVWEVVQVAASYAMDPV